MFLAQRAAYTHDDFGCLEQDIETVRLGVGVVIYSEENGIKGRRRIPSVVLRQEDAGLEQLEEH